jgi:hypothetical protein
MSKKKSDKKSTAKQRDGAKEIKRAEARLAKAVTEMEDARAKVSRRERDLADLLARHGQTPSAVAISESVIALDAPASDPAENGSAHVEQTSESEPVEMEVVDQHD